MALLKKPAVTKPFSVPTLGEVDDTYAAMESRLTDLIRALSTLRQERRDLDQELSAIPAPRMRAEVAALLGDAVVDERQAKQLRLAELRRSIADHEAAIDLQRRRLSEARGAASAKVRDQVRPEYGRRVSALIAALEAAAVARNEYESLCDELEGGDISWTGLGVFRPMFMGDRRDGHVQRLAREAREAGYVN